LLRSEAIALLVDLSIANLVQPSLVALKENDHCHFDLLIKGECNPIELRQFVVSKDLALLVDKEKGMCRIYRP
jgi:hypothetical protein